MGDADQEVVVPVAEIGEWMDEALDVVDEGLGSLLEFVAHLDTCTQQVSLRLQKLERFHRCFTALNLLVVPIVLAIFLCFGTRRDPTDPYKPQTEDVYKTLVTLLMFFSGGIGLPYYLYATWDYFCQEEDTKEELKRRRSSIYDARILEAMSMSGKDFSSYLSNESSVEKLNDIARMLGTRMIHRERSESLRENAKDTAGPSEGRKEEIEVEETEINANHIVEESPEMKHATKSASQASGTSEVNFLYEFQIRMREQSPDLDINVEPHEEDGEVEPLGDGDLGRGIELTTRPPENSATDRQTDASLI